MRAKLISDGVFIGLNVFVVYGNEKFLAGKMRGLVSGWDEKEPDKSWAGCTFEVGSLIVVWLRTADLTNLVHESCHVVDKILCSHNIPLGEESTETRAYLTAFYFRKMREVVRGDRKKGKR